VTGVHWSAVLTGTPDGQIDLDLNLINFQATLRESTASYISVTIPYNQLDDILLRPNGNIEIYKRINLDGTPNLLYSVNFNDTRISSGARSSKLTVSGRSTAAFPAPSAVTLSGVISDGLQASGARTLDVSPFNDVVPGDTVTYASIATVIDLVEVSGDVSSSSMRITEK
jgi:hypothetical protein